MFGNLLKTSVTYQRKLYGAAGDKVIDTFEAYRMTRDPLG